MSDERKNGPSISDEQLLAYADGKASGEERAALDAALTGDPALQARLGALRSGDRPFRESFDHLLDSAPRDRLQALLADAEATAAPTPGSAGGTGPTKGAAAGWFRPAAFAASLLLAVGLGYLGGLLPSNGDRSSTMATLAAEDAWRLAVAEYQVLYTRETLAGLRDDRTQQQSALRRVGDTLGLALSADAVTVPELDYKRAQILRFEDQPLAQLAYLHDDRTPVAFCITRTDQPDDDPRAERLKELNVVHWIKDGFAFMIIGDLPDDLLDRIGRRLADSMG